MNNYGIRFAQSFYSCSCLILASQIRLRQVQLLKTKNTFIVFLELNECHGFGTFKFLSFDIVSNFDIRISDFTASIKVSS